MQVSKMATMAIHYAAFLLLDLKHGFDSRRAEEMNKAHVIIDISQPTVS